ncbi:GNAT family N-acetyltransferase [Pseudofulvibacter geojedonensis]|uniref:GNAT family N-acetyltransferase n=1 Tax=Pseudofulvibacter geojedonensis TaxID=1123758 RepID=A0ABW3I5A1_9FLAO
MFKVRKYKPKDKLLWDTFVKECKNATFLFMRDFMDYHKDRFEDFSLLCFKEDKLIGVLPANIYKGNVYSHQGLTYGGLLVTEKLKFTTFLKTLKSVLDFCDFLNVKHLYIKQLPEMYSLFPNEELEYLHFILKSHLVKVDVSSSLLLTEEMNFSKDRIAGIKKGIKNKLEVREVHDFEEFWNDILIPNLSFRHQVKPTHSCEEISLLKKRFPDNIRQFNVYKDGKIVAGTTLFMNKHLVHSQYMSADKNKNVLGSLDFLHNYLFTQVLSDKKIFDFGISNENFGENINEGLLYWKEGFGARTKVYKQYKITVANKDFLNSILI